jgi:hypothetical protein
MRVHGPSVAIGFSAALLVVFASRRLRPVAIEMGALVVEIVKLGRLAIELPREYIEDFQCEVLHRRAEKARMRREERMNNEPIDNPGASNQS